MLDSALEPSYNLSKNLFLLQWILKLIVDMVNDPTALYICIPKRQMISSKRILLPPSNTFYWVFNAWVVKILYIVYTYIQGGQIIYSGESFTIFTYISIYLSILIIYLSLDTYHYLSILDLKPRILSYDVSGTN